MSLESPSNEPNKAIRNKQIRRKSEIKEEGGEKRRKNADRRGTKKYETKGRRVNAADAFNNVQMQACYRWRS